MEPTTTHMITTRPTAPANLADVSTWTAEQMAWAAPRIADKAAAAAADTHAQARDAASLEAKVELSKIADRYMAQVLFWRGVMLGESPKVPTFLKAQRVRAYQQINERHRQPKTRYAGPKDWGVWSR